MGALACIITFFKINFSIGDFTVKETLMFAADFWLKESAAEKEARVERLIRELGLESTLALSVVVIYYFSYI